MQPGDEDWNEVPWHQFFQAPGERHDIMNFFKERYTFELHRDGKSYSITIEGDPANDESWITVRGTEYKAMVKDIEELPRNIDKAVGTGRLRSRGALSGSFQDAGATMPISNARTSSGPAVARYRRRDGDKVLDKIKVDAAVAEKIETAEKTAEMADSFEGRAAATFERQPHTGGGPFEPGLLCRNLKPAGEHIGWSDQCVIRNCLWTFSRACLPMCWLSSFITEQVMMQSANLDCP